MQVYSSAANALTYRPWSVSCPESSAPLSPLVAQGLIDPIYEPLNPAQFSRTVKTIVQLAHLVRDEVPFIILEDMDVLLILNEIDAYLREIQRAPRTPELVAFLKILMPLRDKVLHLKRRVLRLHPDWASRYHGLDSGYVSMLMQFLTQTGAISEKNASMVDPMDLVRRQAAENGPTYAMPSLQERLQSAREAQDLAKHYQENPGSAYDPGLD